MINIINQELLKKLKENNNKCLCTIDDVDCMCEEFKNTKTGICHCGVFEKMGDEV